MINRLPESYTTKNFSVGSKKSETSTGESLRDVVVQMVQNHPALTLTSAFVIGVSLAWWIKRR